jgi:hypothetical protein
MPTPERLQPVESDSIKVAKIIVSDTLQGQKGDDALLKMTIDALKGPRGDKITQGVMGDYLGAGPNGTFDPRVLEMPVHKVTS